MLNGQPLSEQQKLELNNHVKDLPVIVNLHEDMKSLEGGQKAIMEEFQKHEAENKRQFEHGSDIMRILTDKTDRNAEKIDTVDGKVEALKDKMTEQHNELLNAVKDEKTKDLEQRLEKIVKDKEKNESRLWSIAEKLLIFGLGILATYLGMK